MEQTIRSYTSPTPNADDESTWVNGSWIETVLAPGDLERHDGLLTTEHPASRHGLPVLVIDAQVYGPADWPHTLWPVRGQEHTHVAVAARSVGYRVDEG